MPGTGGSGQGGAGEAGAPRPPPPLFFSRRPPKTRRAPGRAVSPLPSLRHASSCPVKPPTPLSPPTPLPGPAGRQCGRVTWPPGCGPPAGRSCGRSWERGREREGERPERGGGGRRWLSGLSLSLLRALAGWGRAMPLPPRHGSAVPPDLEPCGRKARVVGQPGYTSAMPSHARARPWLPPHPPPPLTLTHTHTHTHRIGLRPLLEALDRHRLARRLVSAAQDDAVRALPNLRQLLELGQAAGRL